MSIKKCRVQLASTLDDYFQISTYLIPVSSRFCFSFPTLNDIRLDWHWYGFSSERSILVFIHYNFVRLMDFLRYKWTMKTKCSSFLHQIKLSDFTPSKIESDPWFRPRWRKYRFLSFMLTRSTRMLQSSTSSHAAKLQSREFAHYIATTALNSRPLELSISLFLIRKLFIPTFALLCLSCETNWNKFISLSHCRDNIQTLFRGGKVSLLLLSTRMNLLRRNFHALLAGVDSLLALPAKIDRLIYGFHYLQLFSTFLNCSQTS
jgi:hypothetical protein